MTPKPGIPNGYIEGKGTEFVLSRLAAKRAKQLKEGSPPLVQIDSAHPLTIALAEIAAGKIKAPVDSDEASPLGFETRSSEFVEDEEGLIDLAALIGGEGDIDLRSADALTKAARASRPADDLGVCVDGQFLPFSAEEKAAWGLGALALPPDETPR